MGKIFMEIFFFFLFGCLSFVFLEAVAVFLRILFLLSIDVVIVIVRFGTVSVATRCCRYDIPAENCIAGRSSGWNPP